MADPALGQKQLCPNCQSKFYDLAKRPAHCPKCEFEFDPEEALKNRRARPRATVRDYEDTDTEAKPVRDEETEAFEEEAEATPEIDEAADEPDPGAADDDAEGGAAAPGDPEPGLGVDFDEEADVAEEEEADDVPFLEDEDADIEGDDIALPGGDEEER